MSICTRGLCCGITYTAYCSGMCDDMRETFLWHTVNLEKCHSEEAVGADYDTAQRPAADSNGLKVYFEE